jgi:hypothetical protein
MGDAFIQKELKGKKWLSFHGRQFTDAGKDYLDYFKCINSLLDSNAIEGVFVTAESSKVTDFAYETITAKDKVFSMERSNVHTNAGNVDARTSELQIAMLQWYMMTQADYCITNPIKASTFALTAMVSGKCQFLLLQADGVCSISNPLPDKEKLIESSPKFKAMPGLVPDKREKIWANVEKLPKLITGEECFKKSKKGDIKPILPFWYKGDVKFDSSSGGSSSSATSYVAEDEDE